MLYLYQNQLNLDGYLLRDQDVNEFENENCKIFKSRKFGCAVSSGTAALEIAIRVFRVEIKMMK